MAHTYLDILDAARDYSEWFDRPRVPGGPAIRMASDVQRDLYFKAILRDPWRFAQRTTVSAPFTLAAPTANLPAYHTLLMAEVNYVGDTNFPDEIPIVSSERQTLYQQGTAVFVEGGALWLTGQTDDWSDVASITVWYIPTLSDLAQETDPITLPDGAKSALVLALAARFAVRVNGFPIDDEQPAKGTITIDVSSIAQMAQAAEAEWLKQIGYQRTRARAAIRGMDISMPKIVQGLS